MSANGVANHIRDKHLNDKLADLVTEAFDAVMEADAKLDNTINVIGHSFDEVEKTKNVDYSALFDSFKTTGLQASSFAQAVEEINRMIACKLKPIDLDAPGVTKAAREYQSVFTKEMHEKNEYYSRLQRSNCTIFLGYTSNMISCGVRETVRFLVKNKMVDCIVTTCGGIEEDFMKCWKPAYLSDYEYDGIKSRIEGMNRIGNMFVPNQNYRLFEDFLIKILDQALVEQNELGTNWTPSKLIERMGREINNEESVYYWAWKNRIPVFCPAITDGDLGDTLFHHSFQNPGLRIDLIEDIQRMDMLSMFAVNTGSIILGGATPKHHILNANCMRLGCNFSVFVNTGQPFDGSDSGAKPNEAFSWGKLRMDSTPVKIYGEASLIFPLLVAQTFAKNFPISN